MTELARLLPVKAALQVINKYFPTCHGALLAGSVVRGEETETSDLDLVIFNKNISSSYRESIVDFGWPIEIFVHNLTSYRNFFKIDCEKGIPTMPRMVAEGIILRDEGVVESIKQEAQDLLDRGPEPWTEETIHTKRYFITDVLDDFIGCPKREEEIFAANKLADLVSEFILRINGQWLGTSKWVFRALKQFDKVVATEFFEAFDHYYRTGEKQSIITFVDAVLAPYGGRYFDGFSLGKKWVFFLEEGNYD